MPRALGAVFSDVDGTVVHYRDKLERLGYVYLGSAATSSANAAASDDHAVSPTEYNGLPVHYWTHPSLSNSDSGKPVVIPVVPVPSATLGGGFCSIATIELVKQLRERGVLFCLLTGARTSTFLERRASGAVPPCDYGVCEGGGRMWNRTNQIDETWADRFADITGPWRDQLDGPCELKKGLLWDAYRRLSEPDVLGAGTGKVKLDGKSFGSAFMVDVRGDASVSPTLGMSTVSDKEEALRRLMEDELTPAFRVAMVVNLGKAHVGPIGLDKRTAVEYIAQLEGIHLRGDAETDGTRRFAAALFDDENDLGFVERCDVGIAPSIAHPSVLPALERLGPNFVEAPVHGFLGTEYAIRRLLDMVGDQDATSA